MSGLSDALRDWTDPDEAARALAFALRLIDSATPRAETKGVLWTHNQLMTALIDMLDVLVRLGALEWDKEREQYRWNAAFDWRKAGIEKPRV